MRPSRTAPVQTPNSTPATPRLPTRPRYLFWVAARSGAMTSLSELDMQAVVTAGPETLERLPRAELERLAELLNDAPERALLTFATRTRWLGGLASRSTIDGLEAGGQRVERRH